MTPFDAATAAMDHPWRWGTHDCCASACTAFEALRGVDPMAPLRGQYASEGEALEMIEVWGGWEHMTALLAAIAGLRPCEGGPGAIGLHVHAGRYSLVLGLGDDLWAGKSPRGLATVTGVLGAWI